MHAQHKLAYADRKTGYYTYYQSLLPHVNKSISNAFRNMPRLSTQMKRTVFQYRTGTLYNQKHAVRYKDLLALHAPYLIATTWIALSASYLVANAPSCVT
eukprot:857150-Pelagomonas_calceolata.AAC.1